MADEMKEPQSPEEKRLWLESTTDMDSETLKKNELKERTLTDPWNRSFTAPNYWTYEDIEQWKELMKENNLEIVSSLEVPYHVAKILNGEEELEAINNLEELTLPQRIESIGQLIDMEKQDRKYAWQFSRLSEKDRAEFMTSDKSIDDFIDEKLASNGIKTVTIESEEEFNRWAEDLDGIDNNPEQVYKDLHGNLPEKGSYIDEGIEQLQANGGMSEAAMEAKFAAQENPRPDYLDEQGNPHWFDEEEETEILSDEEIALANQQNKMGNAVSDEEFLAEMHKKLADCKGNPIAAMKTVCAEWQKDENKSKAMSSLFQGIRTKSDFDDLIKKEFPECRRQTEKDSHKKERDDGIGR